MKYKSISMNEFERIICRTRDVRYAQSPRADTIMHIEHSLKEKQLAQSAAEYLTRRYWLGGLSIEDLTDDIAGKTAVILEPNYIRQIMDDLNIQRRPAYNRKQRIKA